MKTTIIDINFALVEDKRPPMYTSMKYWGKKPHNIWNKYIKTYVDKQGFYLDPFTGSAMSAFESFIAGRKCFAFDLNPLSSFVIETFSTSYNRSTFIRAAKSIIKKVQCDPQYLQLFCYRNGKTLHNAKWDNNSIYEVCFIDSNGNRTCDKPNSFDVAASLIIPDLSNLSYPHNSFRNEISYTATFLSNIGKTYDCLYSKRNLFVLSIIFKNILSISNDDLKKQLLYAFIQTVHLSTKMCVPRAKSANRDFSTSWGRAAFLASKKQMEMNPLLLFENSCWGKQSADSALNDASKRFKRRPKIADINIVDFDKNKNVDIWYGVVDVKHLDKVIPKGTIDFILTDPPYGGLIQYLDLSSVWLSWLELYDTKYKPLYSEEITVNNSKTYDDFSRDFSLALIQMKHCLADNGKLILTFNNKNLTIWNSFLKAISNAGFFIEKIIHQQNKRSGESNVDDPTGVSASDYYIRCIKKTSEIKKLSAEDTEQIVLTTLKEIIEERNEPTPYQVLFNGFMCKLSVLGIDFETIDSDFDKFLQRHKGSDFVVAVNYSNRAGDYWWIKNKKFDKNSKKTLSNKIRSYLDKLFSKKANYTNEELLSLIYKKFSNGMSPDIESLNEIVNEYAYFKNNIWCRRK